MNNIVANFSQILNFAKSYGLPLSKKRAILREYLQSKILEFLYQQKVSLNLFFVGGTSLRLLRGMGRFSEDLDFDLISINNSQIEQLMDSLVKRLKKENIALDFYRNETKRRVYYELRFKDLLYKLGLSGNKEEKLMVKFDFERFWQGQKKKIALFNRYGFLTEVLTIPLEQILVQKLFAYLNRKQTLPRDIYDIIWLYGQRAKVDEKFAQMNKLPVKLLEQVKQKFIQEKRRLTGFKQKLKPFLINEEDIDKLELFPQVIDKLERAD